MKSTNMHLARTGSPGDRCAAELSLRPDARLHLEEVRPPERASFVGGSRPGITPGSPPRLARRPRELPN